MRLFVPLVLLLLTACASGPAPIASGVVENLTKDSLILKNKDQLTFIRIGQSQQPAFSRLRKGESIQLYGRVMNSMSTEGSSRQVIDPQELALADGTRIKL